MSALTGRPVVQKQNHIRSKSLTGLARFVPCRFTFPHKCSTDTMACHANWLSWGKGVGMKAPDWAWASGCQAAHDAIDNKLNQTLTMDQREPEWMNVNFEKAPECAVQCQGYAAIDASCGEYCERLIMTSPPAVPGAQTSEAHQDHLPGASSDASSEVVSMTAAADAQLEIVGHKTFSDDRGGFRHEPLTRADAEAIMALCDAQQAARTARYPTEEDAVRGMCDSHQRLRELGWREAIYAPPDGKLKRVIEVGSSGIHEGYCQARPNRPGEKWWWIPGEGDLWPSKPVLYYPGDDERIFRASGQDKPK